MCIDFTDLNKAYLNDSYPLLYIDQLVDATMGHKLLAFISAFFGYNQTHMVPKDEEKMTFIIDHGLFCYTMMPFGLKNQGQPASGWRTKISKIKSTTT